MRTVFEIVEDLEEKAASARDARQMQHLRDRLVSITKEFRDIAEAIEPVASFIHESVAAGVLNGYPTDGVQCCQDLDRMMQDAINAPQDFVDSSELGGILARLRAIVASWRSYAASGWETYCDKNVQKGQDAIVQAFESSGESVELLSRLRSIDDQLMVLSREAPMDKSGGPALLTRLIKDRAEIWSQLSVGDLPTEVTLFLSSASASGAPLAMLTPSVFEWLSTKNLEDGFVVKSRVDDD